MKVRFARSELTLGRPLIGVALIEYTGGQPWAFAAYMVAVALFSLLVMWFVSETHHKDIYPATSSDTTPPLPRPSQTATLSGGKLQEQLDETTQCLPSST